MAKQTCQMQFCTYISCSHGVCKGKIQLILLLITTSPVQEGCHRADKICGLQCWFNFYNPGDSGRIEEMSVFIEGVKEKKLLTAL